MFIVNTILSIQNVHIIGGTPFQYNRAKKNTHREKSPVCFFCGCRTMQMSAIYLRLYFFQESLLKRIREDECLFTGLEGNANMLLCFINPCYLASAKCFV